MVNVRLECDGCGTDLIVLPPEMFRAVGARLGLEAELQLSQVTETLEAETGDRLAIADVDRFYRCPVCGDAGQLPTEDDLRRLAEG
jgi:hypothetical protein